MVGADSDGRDFGQAVGDARADAAADDHAGGVVDGDAGQLAFGQRGAARVDDVRGEELGSVVRLGLDNRHRVQLIVARRDSQRDAGRRLAPGQLVGGGP